MTEQRKACLVYVAATADRRANVRSALEARGYKVDEVEVPVPEAAAAQSTEGETPEGLRDCVHTADLCVFLLPEEEADDGLLGAAGGVADGLGKPLLGVFCGERIEAPQVFEDIGGAVVRQDSDRLLDAIDGKEIFENPDGSLRERRKIDHVKCQ
jgi:hypothetical protein